MAILGFELEEIIRLLSLLEAGKLDEILIEEEDRYLRIRGPRRLKSARSKAPLEELSSPPRETKPRKAIAARMPETSETMLEALPADCVALVSPMVGVFYRSPIPGDPPFIEIGQFVSLDQTVGLIEAMKIFSEIPAEQEGIVVALPAEDGQLVQAGTPLVILRQE
jgi:acetyl-CoA carboxylase biotin carboxyl carrier protein